MSIERETLAYVTGSYELTWTRPLTLTSGRKVSFETEDWRTPRTQVLWLATYHSAYTHTHYFFKKVVVFFNNYRTVDD